MDDVSPLPYVEVGNLLGMLVYLEDQDGRTDVYVIAQDMDLEVDELLPLIKVAEVLGFVEIKEGDLIISLTGKKLVYGDENERKIIFKESLKKMPVFQKLIKILQSTPEKSISKNDLLQVLSEEMSEDEAQESLRGIIELGRYAELVGYNPEDKEIYLDELEE